MENRKDLIRQVIGFQEEINRLIMEYRVEKWLSLDLTAVQLKGLMYIYSKGKANFKELAKVLNIAPSVVTGIVDRLVRHGVVRRARISNSTDRRVQWLEVTNKGKSILDNLKQQMTRDGFRILETMSDEDLSALAQSFSALIMATEQYLGKRHPAVDTATVSESE